MTTGEAIRNARMQLCLNQKQFCELCGVSRSLLCQIEKDKKEPSLRTLKKILSVLEMSFEELIDIKELDQCPTCGQKRS